MTDSHLFVKGDRVEDTRTGRIGTVEAAERLTTPNLVLVMWDGNGAAILTLLRELRILSAIDQLAELVDPP